MKEHVIRAHHLSVLPVLAADESNPEARRFVGYVQHVDSQGAAARGISYEPFAPGGALRWETISGPHADFAAQLTPADFAVLAQQHPAANLAIRHFGASDVGAAEKDGTVQGQHRMWVARLSEYLRRERALSHRVGFWGQGQNILRIDTLGGRAEWLPLTMICSYATVAQAVDAVDLLTAACVAAGKPQPTRRSADSWELAGVGKFRIGACDVGTHWV